MAMYDDYKKYRDPNLSESEWKDIEEAQASAKKMEADDTLERRPNGFWNEKDGFTIHPVIGAHTMIAFHRAKAQFQGHPTMPEDEDVGLRFPGIDPVGKHSVIDMKFAQREAVITSMLESRSPEVQSYVKELLDKRTSLKAADGKFNQRYLAMQASAEEHRLLTRGSKLCLDEVGSKMMRQQARGKETDLPVMQYDMLLQGIEYAAGVRQGPVPREITEFYKENLKSELDLGVVAAASTRAQTPAELHVEFQDLDNKLLQKAFADPKNWNKSQDDLVKAADTIVEKEASSVIDPYAQATADRLIHPLFRDLEKPAPAAYQHKGYKDAGMDIDIAFSRADLISIGGQTIREKMKQAHELAFGAAGPFDEWFKANVREFTSRSVAAGLMAGQRVEAFIPDKFGRIPKEPTQITKTGYEPTPLKPEKFNAWQRHFAKHGFYKNKVARKEEYERVMAARERMKLRAGISQKILGEERTQALRNSVQKYQALDQTSGMELFFGKIMEEKGFTSATVKPDGKTEVTYNWQAMNDHVKAVSVESVTKPYTQFDRTEPVSTCIMAMVAKGHKFEDIMNPAKLQDERQAAVQEFMEHAKTNDREWLGHVYYHGFKAAMQQVDELTRGVNLQDEAERMRVIPVAKALSHAAFGVSQIVSGYEKCDLAYHQAAVAEAGGNLEKGNQLSNALFNKIVEVSLTSDMLMDGFRGQLRLIDPKAEIRNLNATDLGDAALCCARGAAALAGLKPGAASLVDASLISVEGNGIRAFVIESPQIRAITGALDKGNQDVLKAVARSALNGSLVGEAIQVSTEKGTFPLGDNLHNMVKKEDGTFGIQKTQVPVSYRHFSFKAAKEIMPKEKEGPEMQQQAQQKKAPHRHAPHKMPPQPGERKL